jgi:hypothetical protein
MSLEKNLINRTVEPHYIAYLTTEVKAKSSLYIRAYVYISISQHEQLVLYNTQKSAATTCEHTHTLPYSVNSLRRPTNPLLSLLPGPATVRTEATRPTIPTEE